MSYIATETKHAIAKKVFDEDAADDMFAPPKEVPVEPTSLREAAELGSLSACVTLYAQGHEVGETFDSADETALFWAVLRGHIPCLRFFVERGADINAFDSRGHTPLMWAASGNCLIAARELLDAGADIGVLDSRGCDVFFMAAQHGHLGFIHLLHRHRPIDLSRRDGDGHGVFVWAAYMDSLPVCRYLHEVHGAPANDVDSQGRTALHWAAREGAAAVCAYLMGLGLSPALEDKEGRSPLAWATERRHTEAAAVLKARQTTPVSYVRGTAALVCSRFDFAVMFFGGVLGVLGTWGVITRFLVGFAPFFILMPIVISKNIMYMLIYKTPTFNTKSEPGMMHGLAPPNSVVEAIRGPENTRFRDPAVLGILLAVLATQLITITADGVAVPAAYYVLGALSLFSLAAVKLRAFADVVPRGGIIDDPVLRAVDEGNLADATEPRLLLAGQHLRIPLRAFYCRELDCVVRRYDGWSALFDTPVSHSNHRWFFLMVASLFAQQALLAASIWSQIRHKICNEDDFSLSRTVYHLAMSSLPCAEKPIDDSWWNYLVPSRTSYLGFWLVMVPTAAALLFLGATLRQVGPAIQGVTRAEVNAPTAPCTGGGLASIRRENGSYIYSEGSGPYNFVRFLLGLDGAAWEDVLAVPPQPGAGKRSAGKKA